MNARKLFREPDNRPPSALDGDFEPTKEVLAMKAQAKATSHIPAQFYTQSEALRDKLSDAEYSLAVLGGKYTTPVNPAWLPGVWKCPSGDQMVVTEMSAGKVVFKNAGRVLVGTYSTDGPRLILNYKNAPHPATVIYQGETTLQMWNHSDASGPGFRQDCSK